MARYLILATLLLAWAPSFAGGEIVDIPLELGAPEIYMVGLPVQFDFEAGRELNDIAAVQLHVIGHYRDYRSFCYVFGDFGGGVNFGDGEAGLSQGFVFEGQPVLLTEHVFGNTADGAAPFDLVLDFEDGGEDPDWSFLAGGAGTVYLRGLDCGPFPPYPIICACDASAIVESATLVVHLESLVDVEEQTWGTIKALYR